jgi:4-hydroxyphenylpyruvate dioxygenase-like putative hemolysin
MPDDGLFQGYDHVAYATRNTDATVKILEALGFTLKIYKQQIEKFNVYISKMVSSTGHVAEIVEPIGARSVVSDILKEQDATVYHTCIRTTNFGEARAKMKQCGAVTITKPMRIPYPVTEEHRTFWASHMYHSALGVFEITGPDDAGEE